MFAAIKQSFSNLFTGSSSSQDSFSMEQRTRALLIQTKRNRLAGKQMQKRAHRPMQAAAQQSMQKPDNKGPKVRLTNLNSDIF